MAELSPLLRLDVMRRMDNQERREHASDVAARIVQRHNERCPINPNWVPMRPTSEQVQYMGNALWRFARATKKSAKPDAELMRDVLWALGELGDLGPGRPQGRATEFVREMQRWFRKLTGTRGCAVYEGTRKRYVGAFFPFIEDCFAAVGKPCPKHSTIYRIVSGLSC